MNVNQAIILGWVNEGKVATDGESVKNQVIINQLRELGIQVYVLDFFQWKKRPWILIKALLCLLIHNKTPLILSSSASNVYPIMKAHYLLKSKRKIIHWVIGGQFADRVKKGVFDAKVIDYLSHNLVESIDMVNTLNSLGIYNAQKVPNFKPIKEMPVLHKDESIKKFVFLSRIMPEKGVDYILEAVANLNAKYKDKFIVDFYGKIQDEYQNTFYEKVNNLSNVEYKGFLNFNNEGAYDQLAEYNAMLFPTYWKGEGFAGIFIDAFIAGLPILASRWGHNEEYFSEGNTGCFYEANSEKALEDTMERVLNGSIDLTSMYSKCQKEAEKYNVSNIITNDFLNKILK